MKPTAEDVKQECLNCLYKRNLPFDAHIACDNPDPNMRGTSHGISNGWFIYPINFDPIWKAKRCDNFEPKTKESKL